MFDIWTLELVPLKCVLCQFSFSRVQPNKPDLFYVKYSISVYYIRYRLFQHFFFSALLMFALFITFKNWANVQSSEVTIIDCAIVY